MCRKSCCAIWVQDYFAAGKIVNVLMYRRPLLRHCPKQRFGIGVGEQISSAEKVAISGTGETVDHELHVRMAKSCQQCVNGFQVH